MSPSSLELLAAGERVLSKKRVNIVYWSNAGGLVHDASILAATLSRAGCRVSFNGGPRFIGLRMERTFPERLRRWTKRVFALWTGRPVFDVTIFLEGIYPEFLGESACTVLIPNQEWFRDNHHVHLPRMDWILCKTQDAVRIFDELGCKTRFIGFTSSDRRDTAAPSKEDTFFHLAGMSQQKGTDTILELWQRHPEWPNLLVIQAAKTHDGNPNRRYHGSNINHVLDRVSAEQLKLFQNKRRFHLCLSEAEGFGHYIVEALSCNAVVFTTDAPPMNEIVQSTHGILVSYSREVPQSLAKKYIIDPLDLERRIEAVLRLPTIEHERMGAEARAFYEENDKRFHTNIVNVIRGLIESAPRGRSKRSA